MLPKELLDVRRQKDRIIPKFAGNNELRIAEEVIEIFRRNKGSKYIKIKNEIKKIENAKNYKKVRGFAKIVERNCSFEISSELNPVEVREYLFKRGYITTKSERDALLQRCAENFNTTKEVIERAMFADRDEEQILIEVPEFEPYELTRLYNLSLFQTAIFDSLRLTFTTSSNHKEIFRRIKYLGLMYEIENSTVSITGAASIIKMTKKYGTSIAKLIPEIIKSEKWEIDAEILDDFSGKIYRLKIDDSYREVFPIADEPIMYDSSLEEEFSRKIKAIKPGIEILREPGVFRAGKYAFIPDFVIKKGDKEVYIEIAGFWTSDYIRRKVEKIKELKIPLILIAREDYGIDRASGDVILFSSKIPYNAVIKKINEEFRTGIDEVKLEGDVVNLVEMTEGGISMPELVKLAESSGYVIAGSHAVRAELLEKIRDELNSINPQFLSDIREVLNRYNVSEDVLERIGYKVVWTGLFEDNAKLEKVENEK